MISELKTFISSMNTTTNQQEPTPISSISTQNPAPNKSTEMNQNHEKTPATFKSSNLFTSSLSTLLAIPIHLLTTTTKWLPSLLK